MNNKKVRNTQGQEYDNIKFRSKLEVSCYKLLKEAGFNPVYEQQKATLLDSFKPKNFRRWEPDTKKNLTEQTTSIRAITYTSDFTFSYKKYDIIVEAKGHPNDAYPIKKKFYFQHLESINSEKEVLFFEPHNIKQIKQMIDIIKALP